MQKTFYFGTYISLKNIQKTVKNFKYLMNLVKQNLNIITKLL